MKKRNRTPHRKALSIVRHYFPKVESVIDAGKPVIVEVTLADRAISKRKDHQTCALAVACKRAFKADGVIIGLGTSYIIKGNKAIRFHNANTISREITSFDRAGVDFFDTGFYRLSPVAPAARLGVPQWKGKPHRNSSGGSSTARFRHFTKGVRTTLGHVPEIS